MSQNIVIKEMILVRVRAEDICMILFMIYDSLVMCINKYYKFSLSAFLL